MKGFVAFSAALGVANAFVARGGYSNTTSTEELTTSTVYTTQIRTVTHCPETVTDCPTKPHVTTETIALYTTVCPVTEKHPQPPQTEVHPPASTSTWVAPPPHGGNQTSWTSTLYTTKTYVVSKCPSEVPHCPIGETTTTVYATATTCYTDVPKPTHPGQEQPPKESHPSVPEHPSKSAEQPPKETHPSVPEHPSKPVEQPPKETHPSTPEQPSKPVVENPPKESHPGQQQPPKESHPSVPETPSKSVEQPPAHETKPVSPPAESKPASAPSTPVVVVPVPTGSQPAQVTAGAARNGIQVVAAAAGLAALFL